jgi:hypothetical protein
VGMVVDVGMDVHLLLHQNVDVVVALQLVLVYFGYVFQAVLRSHCMVACWCFSGNTV